jgi:hypothetical protein
MRNLKNVNAMPNLKKVKAGGTQKGDLSTQIPFCQLPSPVFTSSEPLPQDPPG